VSDRVPVTIASFLEPRRYLRRGRSVFAQTPWPTGAAAIDDGSTDGFDRCVRHLDDPRVRCPRRWGNRGLCARLNRSPRLHRHLSGAVDADDLMHPERIERHSVSCVRSQCRSHRHGDIHVDDELNAAGIAAIGRDSPSGAGATEWPLIHPTVRGGLSGFAAIRTICLRCARTASCERTCATANSPAVRAVVLLSRRPHRQLAGLSSH